MDLMGLFLEIMTNTLFLVIQPFSLLRVASMYGVRTICLVTHIWLHFVGAIINFNLDICWKVMVWILAFVTLPMRILTALQRERLLVMHLHDMQVELEDLAWDKKQLGEQLERATKDCKILGSIISELEEEHDEAMAKIDHLENELQQHLKEENTKVTEIQGKAKWNFVAQDEYICENVIDNNKNGLFVTEYDTSSLRSGDVFQDLLMHRKEGESNSQPHDLLKTGSGVLHPISPGIIPRSLPRDEALDGRWGVALSQSFFSTTLSLLVGIIIWQAQDACMPLVVALFIVVGMSLRSVVQFFYTIENRPAYDTVALLSVNWFILGTLTYPTLPKVARVFVPLVLSLADKMVYWFGLSSFCG